MINWELEALFKGKNLFFCSSVPNEYITGAHIPIPKGIVVELGTLRPTFQQKLNVCGVIGFVI